MGKTKEFVTLPEGTKVPDHIALVPDGDRRWARAKGLNPSEGHRAGTENLIKLARAIREWGVHTISVWGLSTENWQERPKEEVDFLLKGIVMAMDRYVDEMDRDGVKFVHLGRKDRLPRFLLDKVSEVENRTRNNTKHIFNMALDYNGPDEVIRAVNKVIKDLPAGRQGLSDKEITKKEFEGYFDNAGQPYPYVDLFIRTSGEQRTSGFMMWQTDYAEMYWEEDHFPAFTVEKLRDAILDYSRRRRRFGGNDAMEHMKFDPRVVARLELDWRRALSLDKTERLSDLVIKYVREQYGLSKELAKTAGISMAKALVYRQAGEWEKARESLKGLYEVVRKNVGLALEPEIVANIEVNMWKQKNSESGLRGLLAEKFRVSEFQATKSAHLGFLASQEVDKGNWVTAKDYMEKYYQALKERVA